MVSAREISIVLVVLGAAACGRQRTERHCQQAAAERARNDPNRAFPTERFLAACRRLSPDDAQCTIPSFAGSHAVLSARECRSAYMNPAFPRDIILGTEPSAPSR